jgi:hypothetical protein
MGISLLVNRGKKNSPNSIFRIKLIAPSDRSHIGYGDENTGGFWLMRFLIYPRGVDHLSIPSSLNCSQWTEAMICNFI